MHLYFLLQQQFHEDIIKVGLKTNMAKYLLRANSLFFVDFSS